MARGVEITRLGERMKQDNAEVQHMRRLNAAIGLVLDGINQHAILVSGTVPNDCPDRDVLVGRIHSNGLKNDNERSDSTNGKCTGP